VNRSERRAQARQDKRAAKEIVARAAELDEPIVKPCQHCGETFLTYFPMMIYCSGRCARLGERGG
jgi:hypothetical protein